MLLALTSLLAPSCDADDTPAAVEACIDDCGVGCPAPQFQVCGEDGQRYCGACVMACYGVEQADDRSVCHTTNPDEDTCIAECGDGCAAPDEQPCASDGSRYCSECVIACKNLFVEQDDALCQ